MCLFFYCVALGTTKDNSKPKATKAKAFSRVVHAKGKGSRSSSSSGSDTAEMIRSYLWGMRQAGLDQVDETDILQVTGYARTDSTGYRKVMKELTKTLQHVTKSKGIVSLTKEGLDYIAANGGVQLKVTPPSMEEHQEKLKQSVINNAKVPVKAILAIWNLLLDGQDHAVMDLVQAGGYKRTDSTGYREVMKWLKKLELVDKKQGGAAYGFADKVYRYGSRPTTV